MRKLLVVLLVLVLAVTSVLTTIPEAKAFTRVSTLTLNADENIVAPSVIDSAAGFAYFGTVALPPGTTNPAVIVKVRLSDFTRVDSLTLNTGESYLSSAVIDSAGGFAYFGTFTFPGIIVKVRLSDFIRVDSITLNTGEDGLSAAVIDTAAGFAYFGGGQTTMGGIIYPSFVVKIDLSGPVTTTCGASSCTIASNSTISNPSFGSNTLQFDATGPANTVGYANVTVPASLVPDIAQIQVTINGAVIPSSKVQTGTVTGGYWVYFTFTFHSTAHVSIALVPPVTTGGLKVTVNDQNGYGVQGATVQITAAPTGQTLPAAVVTGSDGTATFSNLSPGTYTYKVTASGYEDKQVTATVTAGQTLSSQARLTQVQQAPSQPSVDYTLYAGLGVAALVVLLGVFLALRRRRVTPKTN